MKIKHAGEKKEDVGYYAFFKTISQIAADILPLRTCLSHPACLLYKPGRVTTKRAELAESPPCSLSKAVAKCFISKCTFCT